MSWLRLERYHAGELAADERETIRRHLEGCPACTACAARIDADARVPLPPLPIAKALPRRRSRLAPLVAGVAGMAGLAMAASIGLFLFRGTDDAARTKGDSVDFALIGERTGSLSDASGTYADGERFKVLVTCPPDKHASWDVAIFENGVPSFPLPEGADLACGNAVPLFGAFRLTGREPQSVCLVWRDDGQRARAELSREEDLSQPGIHALCKRLEPSP